MIIPLEAVAIPLLFMVSELGWRNTYHVQILPFVANPLFMYLFYTFFLGIPTELEEAAKIDGAGPITTFLRVVAPLAKPVYATVGILSFLFIWGQLLWPVLVTSGNRRAAPAAGHRDLHRPAPDQLGRHHGVCAHDDVAAARRLHTLPALVRAERRPQRPEGLTTRSRAPRPIRWVEEVQPGRVDGELDRVIGPDPAAGIEDRHGVRADRAQLLGGLGHVVGEDLLGVDGGMDDDL